MTGLGHSEEGERDAGKEGAASPPGVSAPTTASMSRESPSLLIRRTRIGHAEPSNTPSAQEHWKPLLQLDRAILLRQAGPRLVPGEPCGCRQSNTQGGDGKLERRAKGEA